MSAAVNPAPLALGDKRAAAAAAADSADTPTGSGSSSGPAGRPRSSSIKDVIDYVSNPPKNHRLSHADFKPNTVTPPETPGGVNAGAGPSEKDKKRKKRKEFVKDDFSSRGLWNDLYTMRWMRIPESALKIILTIITLWFILEVSLPVTIPNPLSHALFISYPLPPESALLLGSATTSIPTPLADRLSTFSLRRLLRPNSSLPPPPQPITHYGKGPLDVAFLAFYIIVFSFVRQSYTEWFIRPAARWWGIRGEGKLYRCMEQGYAFFYFTITGTLGLIIMSHQSTWWYQTRQMWIGYPHWRMDAYTKYYYLFQFSYWLQQMLVLVLRIEKPRPDFFELIIHHIVTLWLVGWSYTINLTLIGVAIFVSMDVPDAFLALAKTLNYMKLSRTADACFVVFLGTWTYFRHYLNLKILWSVWFEFPNDVPVWARIFRPSTGAWLVGWMRYQVFAPILLLQFVNLFWYYLILRILFRILRGNNATDVREEEEEAEEKRILEEEERDRQRKKQ